MNDSDMEGIYENVSMTKSDHSRPLHLQTAPQGSKTGLYGALVFLGLMCACLLVGVIVLGVYYTNAVSCAVTEVVRTNNDQIPTKTTTAPTCPWGWMMFQYGSYFLSNVTGQWETGNQDCRSRGAHLAIINSTDEQKFISRFKDDIWIGLNDLEEEGTMKWVDGSPVTFSFWNQGQPDNGNNDRAWGEEDCVYVRSTGEWNDRSCSTLFHWICEKKLSTCFN